VKPIQWLYLLEARSDFRRTWPQLLLTDMFSRIIVVVALTPIVGLLIKVFLLQTDDGVLSDTDIVVFLLHPIGITALLIVCAVSLGVLFAQQGVLMVVGFGAVEDRRMTWLDSIRYVTRYAFELVYLLFLNKHDINFYLVDKPPEFWWAIAIAGGLMMIMAVIVLKKCASWIITMPLILFQGNHAKQALRESAWKVYCSRVITLSRRCARVLGRWRCSVGKSHSCSPRGLPGLPFFRDSSRSSSA